MFVRKTREEEERGRGYIIDYYVHFVDQKSSSYDKKGLVLTLSFDDLIIYKTSNFSEIFSNSVFSQKSFQKFKSFVCRAISERINKLQFDNILLQLIDLEAKLNGV